LTQTTRRILADLRKARRQGVAAIALRQRRRLAEIVAHARTASPYYAELYQDVPEHVDDPALLPVTSKERLMARFDDWATDRQVTLDAARAFLVDTDRIGEPFLGRYLLVTSSGTSGRPGIFLQDERYDAVSNALQTHMFRSWLRPSAIVRLLLAGQRTAALFATGGHYAGYANAERARRASRSTARRVRVFSVHTPLPELVAQLSDHRPALIMGYATTLALLAAEQQAGRLHLRPVLVIATAEGLPDDEYQRVARAFGAPVRNLYGCSEFAYPTVGCAQGWLHVNGDWVVLEPVDADHRPTPAGELSHTVLLTNLANRVQPILRYDLGDRAMWRPDPCLCGDPLPAIRVQGRSYEMLTFAAAGGAVTLAPLAFSSLADRIPGIDRFQIVQTRPATLRLRLRVAAGSDAGRVWEAMHTQITHLLDTHQLGHVRVERDDEPPTQTPGGKYRSVVPLTDD
jgi:phenylacetate-coenzyme A ligase PaaK-like adenylate-forming protein